MEMKITMPDPATAGPHTKIESMVPLAACTDEEFRELVDSIMVVIPHRQDEGVSPGIFHNGLIWSKIGLMTSTLKDPHGGFVEIVRGHIERVFLDQSDLNPKLKYVVMIDNDQAMEWDAPLKLARHGLPVVSGVVCGFNPERGVFACFTTKDENGVPRFPSYRFTKQFPGKGIKEVYQTGSGLLCVRRDVFETLIDRGMQGFMIDEALRKDSYRVGHIKQGEDFSFSDKVREAGFKIHVDFSVKALHFKRIALGWPEEMVDDDLDANDWTVNNLDFRGLRHAV